MWVPVPDMHQKGDPKRAKRNKRKSVYWRCLHGETKGYRI